MCLYTRVRVPTSLSVTLSEHCALWYGDILKILGPISFLAGFPSCLLSFEVGQA